MNATCPECGVEIAPEVLSCPGCRRLVHAAELKTLADEAARSTAAGDRSSALAAWRRALDLLPRDSRQHEVVLQTVQDLSRQMDQGSAAPSAAPRVWKAGNLAGLGAVGLLAWKFKAVFVFLATKAKFLIGGLTKASTFFSMLLAVGVYWTAWGWKFALGVVVSIYVHEMGHVAMLRRYGIAASAPMFIPGLGAIVRLKQYPANPVEDSRVGLAGPIWGLGAAVSAWLLWLATGNPFWGAVARFGAWINLFNLLPVWQLDGGRGFRSLSRWQRWAAAAAIAVAWFLTAEGLLVLLLIAALIRCFGSDAGKEPDPRGLVEYVLLIAALSPLSVMHVPVPGQ